MKKITILSILLLGLTFTYTSCIKDLVCVEGEGDIVVVSLDIDEFTGINSMGAENVIITQGAVQSVEAHGQQNIIDQLNTSVYGGVWKIKLDDDFCYTDYDLSIYITVPNIEEISITGSAEVYVNDFTGQDMLDINITGSGDVELKDFKDCTNLTVDIIGSGKIYCKGDFDQLEKISIDVSGSGNFEGFNARTDFCDINISGAGNCQVAVDNQLDVKISGAGFIYYKGNPALNSEITGTGNLIDAN